jgi:hypothetical protein
MSSDALFQMRRRARLRLGAAAAIAAAVVVALIAAVILVGHGSTPARHPTAATPVPTVSSTIPAGTGAPHDAEPATGTVPADVTWAQDAGISVPVSAHAGPHDTTGGLARGFSHDPAGAVIAAVHLLVNTSPNVGPDVFDATISNQVVGPDAATLQANAQAAYQQLIQQAGIVYGQPAGGTTTVIRGYRVRSYSANSASVQVLITTTDSTDGADTVDWIAINTSLTWWHGDWALEAPAGGVWDNAMVLQPPSPAGFEQFLTAGGDHG